MATIHPDGAVEGTHVAGPAQPDAIDPFFAGDNNVLKTYATAIAIVLTCAVGCISTRTAPSFGFLQGMTMVIASIFLYNLGPIAGAKETESPPPTEADDADADDGKLAGR